MRLAPGQHSKKKRCSGDDLLATLSVYALTGLEVEPLLPTPKAMSLPLYHQRVNEQKIYSSMECTEN